MLLAVLAVITLVLTYFEIKTRNMPLGAVASWEYYETGLW